MQADSRLSIPAPPLVTSTGQPMARAEALLPHPAAGGIPIDLSRGEPRSDHQTDHPTGDRFEVMAAGLSPVAFFFSGQTEHQQEVRASTSSV
jgi:hypothetical protein